MLQKEVKDKIYQLLISLEKNEPLPKQTVRSIVDSFNFKLPETYVEVLSEFNGGEGDVGKDSWLILFPVDELKQINEDYSMLMSNIPEYLLFGKDAADTGYAFHKIYGTFHSFGLMSNFDTDSIELLGHDFIEFLEYLHKYRFDS